MYNFVFSGSHIKKKKVKILRIYFIYLNIFTLLSFFHEINIKKLEILYVLFSYSVLEIQCAFYTYILTQTSHI